MGLNSNRRYGDRKKIMGKSCVDILIIIPPMSATNKPIFPPYGAMYVASALRQKGYNPQILNIDLDRIPVSDVIDRIRDADPDYIGYSGIVAPSYKYIKDLSIELRRAFPQKKQILGGGLSSAAEVVLKNTAVDIVVCGEGEITAVELLGCLKNNGDIAAVRGLYCKKEDGSVRCTGDRPLIKDLDTLPYPAFDLIDMDRYLTDGPDFIRSFPIDSRDRKRYDGKRNRKMMTILTSRGCFAECSFCFRAYRGIRFHSIKYVFDLIEYCTKKFGAGFFSFGDECFAANRVRYLEFLDEYRKRKSDIVFRLAGARVDTVDKDMLAAYRDIGCWMIEYGFESGSQKMLDIMNKGATIEENRNAALWTKEAGIYTTPTLVLAMPGENDRTIRESADFLKSLNLNFKQYQWTYALPIPGSALYEFAKLTGAIKDEDGYLSSLDGKRGAAGVFHINLTDYPDDVVGGWEDIIKSEVDGHYFSTRYSDGVLSKIMYFAEMLNLHYARGDIGRVIVRVFSRPISVFIKRYGTARNVSVNFRKDKNLDMGYLLDSVGPDRKGGHPPLKQVNNMLRERQFTDVETK